MATGKETEKAMPKRGQDEREKGNVFQSSDVVAACSMLVMFRALKALTSRIYRNFRQGIYLSFSYGENSDRFLAWSSRGMLTKAIMLPLEAALSPPFIGILVAVTVISFQTRMAFSMDVLKFKGERISPSKGFKGMMSVRLVVELIKALVRITILGWMAYDFLKGKMRELVVLMEGSVRGTLISIGNTVISLMDAVGVAFVFLATLDYMHQWWEYEKNLRISKQEIKEEYKQTEGDPQIKGKVKEKQRQMVSRCMIQNVPKADVIIRDLTCYAIALGYDPSQSRAPVVSAERADHLTLKTMEAGEANGIYILKGKPLARGLYASIEVDMKIPEEYYQAAAGILTFVYRLNRRDIWLWIRSREEWYASE